MAYNSFYNPFMGFQQTAPNTYQQQAQYAATNGLIWVDTTNELYTFPVAPNAAVVIGDKSNPTTLCLKWADATGKPNMRFFDERKPPQMQTADYATKADLNGVLAEMDGLKQRLDEMAAKPGKTKKEAQSND